MLMVEMDAAAITEVAPKKTLSAWSPHEIQINDYQPFSHLISPLCHRGVCLYVRDGLKASVIILFLLLLME